MGFRSSCYCAVVVLILLWGCSPNSMDGGPQNDAGTMDLDADADADTDADADADADTDTDADADTDTDADADTDTDADADTDTDADADTDTDADADTDTDADADSDTDADADNDTDTDTDTDSDTDTDTDTDSDSILTGDIEFTPPSMTYEETLDVSLATDISGAEIRYTVDGSLPTASSTLYDGNPVALSETAQIRAQAFVGGTASGAPGTALYVARTFDTTSDLPLVLVDGYGLGKPQDKEVFKDAVFMTFETKDGTAALSNPPTVATRAGWHLRGQSSASFEKAPYRVELWDNDNEDLDYEILGLPEEADWALIGPYADRTLIRNAFVFTLGRDIGLEAPRFAFAETFINYEDRPLGPEDYQGVYMVVETIKNAKNRTDLKQLKVGDTDPKKISGGYIMKFDQMAAEEPTLLCSGSDLFNPGFIWGGGAPSLDTDSKTEEKGICWSDLEVVDPVPLDPVQQTWITEYIQAFHETLHEEPMGDVFSYIDIDSFVDHFIINELTRDVDAYIRSSFYHKERDGLLKAGPLWDYNFSLSCFEETGNEGDTFGPEGWQWEDGRLGTNDWFILLPTNSEFMTTVSQRWQELRQTFLSDSEVDARIDRIKAPLANAAARDLEIWPVGSYKFMGGRLKMPDDPTWEGQIEVMRTWIHARLAWLDSQL